MSDEHPQINAIVEILESLAAEARIYERVLRADDHTARMAIAALTDLAQTALAEARDLADLLQNEKPTNPNLLSPREQEVLGLVALGLTNKEIAYRLAVSDRTVQFHLNSVFNKTGANSRTEAVTAALRKGWLTLSKRD